jgi:transposase
MPDRQQLELRAWDLESTVAPDHRVRLVWAFVERLDLSSQYAQIKAVRGGVGRPPIAPEILLSLWLYATLESVGSARAVARLVQEHDAYRWLCGGVSVNHHTLSDFRVGQGALLDELLTMSVASLVNAGAVTLTRLAQDGMRVRASAGSKSFRRRLSLEGFLTEARQHVADLKAQVESDPAAHSRAEHAARERAAREREEKLEAALKRLPELEAAKVRQQGRAKKKSERSAHLDDGRGRDDHEDAERRL